MNWKCITLSFIFALSLNKSQANSMETSDISFKCNFKDMMAVKMKGESVIEPGEAFDRAVLRTGQVVSLSNQGTKYESSMKLNISGDSFNYNTEFASIVKTSSLDLDQSDFSMIKELNDINKKFPKVVTTQDMIGNTLDELSIFIPANVLKNKGKKNFVTYGFQHVYEMSSPTEGFKAYMNLYTLSCEKTN